MTQSQIPPTSTDLRTDIPPKQRWVVQDLVGQLAKLAWTIKYFSPILADNPRVAELCRNHQRSSRAFMLRLRRHLDQADARFLRASHGTESDDPWSWQASPEQNESILKVNSACAAISDHFKRAVQARLPEVSLLQTHLHGGNGEGDFDALLRWCAQKDICNEIKVTWYLDENDPDFNPDDDNIIHENTWWLGTILSDITPPPGGELTQEFNYNDRRPRPSVNAEDWRNSAHHYLFHDLIDHAYGEFSPLKPWVAARIGSVTVALTATSDFDLRVKPKSNAASQQASDQV